jgi:hypothetical protein
LSPRLAKIAVTTIATACKAVAATLKISSALTSSLHFTCRERTLLRA